MLAPIVLFVYNRPDHTRLTINALLENNLAIDSILYIYSDAAKRDEDNLKVNAVREIIRKVNGFKSVVVIEADINLGLAASIIKGVTDVCNRYGKIIVLEDDILVSPSFLSFMNEALDRYQTNYKVWHISGWNYPVDKSNLPEVFFWRAMNCWGWATWSDRWHYFQKDPHRLDRDYGTNKNWINYFNLEGVHDFWWQVQANISGEINTWAIFWFATIIEHSGYCLNPSSSYVVNKGLDGSGEHCDATNVYGSVLNNTLPISWQNETVENELAVMRIKDFYNSIKRPTLAFRAWRKIKKVISKI